MNKIQIQINLDNLDILKFKQMNKFEKYYIYKHTQRMTAKKMLIDKHVGCKNTLESILSPLLTTSSN